MEKHPQKLALGVKETASLLSLHPNSVRKLLRDGALPHLRVGRRVLVPVAGIEALLEGKTPAGGGGER